MWHLHLPPALHGLLGCFFYNNDIGHSFAPGIGRCHHHIVSSFPFTFHLPLKQYPWSVIFGPTEESNVLEEVLKMVNLGVVREVKREPYVILAFGVSKKNGVTRLVLDFRNSILVFRTCRLSQSIENSLVTPLDLSLLALFYI